jgi:hypothetical protein
MKNTDTLEDRYFKTSSFYTAAYLYAKDCELINIDKTADPRRAQFVFINTPELDILVNIFNFAKDNDPDLQVNSRSFITAIKNLKTLLYQQDE